MSIGLGDYKKKKGARLLHACTLRNHIGLAIGNVHGDFKAKAQICECRCGPLHLRTPFIELLNLRLKTTTLKHANFTTLIRLVETQGFPLTLPAKREAPTLLGCSVPGGKARETVTVAFYTHADAIKCMETESPEPLESRSRH